MPPTINVDSIPEFQKNALADMALDLTRACFEIPGMEERYQQGSSVIGNGNGSAPLRKEMKPPRKSKGAAPLARKRPQAQRPTSIIAVKNLIVKEECSCRTA